VNPVPILLYHTVAYDVPDKISPFNVQPRHFTDQLDVIVDSGRTVLTVSQFVDAVAGRGDLPARPLVITFDDGYADFAETALPALVARRLPSTLYVTTGMLRGGQRRIPKVAGPAKMLAWDQLAEMEEHGVEIGGHSHTHPELDLMRPDREQAEIRLCKELLEDELRHPITTFAYPFGLSRRAVRTAVRDAGYVSACSVKNAFSSRTDNVFALARLTVFADTTTDDLRNWLAGRGARTITRGQDGLYTLARLLARRIRFRLGSGFPGGSDSIRPDADISCAAQPMADSQANRRARKSR